MGCDVWPEVNTYTDYKAMLREERLDLLSVATSDHLHADMVVDAVAAGGQGHFLRKAAGYDAWPMPTG